MRMLWIKYSVVLMVSVTVTYSSDHCPDAHNREPVRDFENFHWDVLGVAGKPLAEQLDWLVEILLKGFDCERRIQNIHCSDGHRINLTCTELKDEVLNGTQGSPHQLAVRVFMLGMDLEHMLCMKIRKDFPPTDAQKGLCRNVEPRFMRYINHRFLDFQPASKWRPGLMRHLVWRGCPEGEAFIKKRKCIWFNKYQPLMSLLCSARITDVISQLSQGHRILSNMHQSCDIQYAEDIFTAFGSTSGESYTWTLDKHDLATILQNLSMPYPDLPVTNRTTHTPHSHPSHPHNPRPLPGEPGGPRPDPDPEYWRLPTEDWRPMTEDRIQPHTSHRGVSRPSRNQSTSPILQGGQDGPNHGSKNNLGIKYSIFNDSHYGTALANRTSLQTSPSTVRKEHIRPGHGHKTKSETRGNQHQASHNSRAGFRGKTTSGVLNPERLDAEQSEQNFLPNSSIQMDKNADKSVVGTNELFPTGAGSEHTTLSSEHFGTSDVNNDHGKVTHGVNMKARTKRNMSPFHREGLLMQPDAFRFPHLSLYPTISPTSDIWNASKLIELITGSPDNAITIRDFYEMCPVLIHHLLLVLKLPVQAPHITSNTSDTPSTTAEVYGYSSLAVFIITLCSLVGVVFVKIATDSTKRYIMAAMLALAVGNLCGDAILHLVPEVIGEDGTDVDGDGHFTNEVMLLGNSDIELSSVKMMLMLASIYLFFLLELVTSIYHNHDHDVDVIVIPESQIPKKKALKRVTGPGSSAHLVETTSNTSLSSSMELAIPSADSISSLPSVPEETDEPVGEIQVRVKKKKDDKDIQAPLALAWMVIVGDAIHNFADGLEIGATFSESLAGGLSTSLAVFCHELPHELGDFAVLISTGMSIKRALILNFVSGLTAFIGLYIGIVTGQQENVRTLIFAVGAGMFLYVALANLIPELMKYFQRNRNWKMFFCQNIGLLAGYSVMIIIAIYEDEIKV